MPKTLIPDPNGDSTNISVPLPGEKATAESIESPIQKLLNKIASLDVELAALEDAARIKGVI